jgi:ribokinase
MARPRIVVIGSSNTDLTVVVERLPVPGETVMGEKLMRAGGGKGANQAVAAARAGADVAFVGKVGDDEFGRATLENLRREHINTQYVGIEEQSPSGVALIMVDKKGENSIAVAPGANSRLSPADVKAAEGAIRQAGLVLLQLEIPLETVEAAVATARGAGVPVLLNPAPAPPPGSLAGLLRGMDYLTPNMGEAARLLGAPAGESPESMARRLVQAGVRTVFLTVGADGVYICAGDECMRVSVPRVRVVDTVGAGDCFTGALSVALAEGMPLRTAASFAACAAALSVQAEGAQPSLPMRAAIDRMLKEHSGS